MVKTMTELDQEQEALLLNREMLLEVKNLIDDINGTKNTNGHYLRAFIHGHWGSIVGNEEDIRLAVIKDEVEVWEQRVGNKPDFIPYTI